MATWKKVIVSGSQADLAAVSASIALRVGTNQIITTSATTTVLSGSFSGSFQGTVIGGVTTATSASVVQITDTTSGTGPYYITFVSATSGHPAQLVDSNGLRYDATTNALTASIFASTQTSGIGFVGTSSYAMVAPYSGLTGVPSGIVSASSFSSNTQGSLTASINGVATNIDLGLEPADTPTFTGVAAAGSSFALAASATSVTIAGSGTNPTITLGNGGSSNVVIPGNLTVNGNTTVVNTTNVEVKDAFILLASGSVTANQDGGIIVQTPSTNGTGSAFYWEGTDSRWAVAQTIPASSTSITPNSYVVTVSGSSTSGAAPGGVPQYGGATNGIGNIFIDTSGGNTDNNIWIYA